jgi:hypothetical protein
MIKPMVVIKYILPLLILLSISKNSFSQIESDSTDLNYNTQSTSVFGLGLGGSLEYTTPQKYGLAINVTLGNKTTEKRYQGDDIYLTTQGIKGINLEAGLMRGGYRFGAYYGNFGWSMIGVVGTRIGVVYLKNNSFSKVLKSQDLIGLEAEIFAFYKIKVGVLKPVNEKRYIPSLGFGFGIGPFF